jgi:hypothetical protein
MIKREVGKFLEFIGLCPVVYMIQTEGDRETFLIYRPVFCGVHDSAGRNTEFFLVYNPVFL